VEPPSWLDELDLHAGPPEAVMGTHALDESRWFDVDEAWSDQRREACAILDARRPEVLAGSARAEVAASRLDVEVATWIAERAPHADDGAHDDADPLARARRRVADDLCLLVPDGEKWVLAAACVCFPSFWRVADKVGHPLSFVHEPVPGYGGLLEHRVDSFLGRLRRGQGVWRTNWSVHATSTLHVPVHEHLDPLPPPEERWLRSERQTLRRLHDVDAVAFTIRTRQVPLAALDAHGDVCADLADAIDAWSPRQRDYKGSAVDDTLLRWLTRDRPE